MQTQVILQRESKKLKPDKHFNLGLHVLSVKAHFINTNVQLVGFSLNVYSTFYNQYNHPHSGIRTSPMNATSIRTIGKVLLTLGGVGAA